MVNKSHFNFRQHFVSPYHMFDDRESEKQDKKREQGRIRQKRFRKRQKIYNHVMKSARFFKDVRRMTNEARRRNIPANDNLLLLLQSMFIDAEPPVNDTILVYERIQEMRRLGSVKRYFDSLNITPLPRSQYRSSSIDALRHRDTTTHKTKNRKDKVIWKVTEHINTYFQTHYIVFATLTISKKHYHNRREITKTGWKTYLQNIQEHCVDVEYIRVIEYSKSNRLHIHAILFLEDPPKSWMKYTHKGRPHVSKTELEGMKRLWGYGRCKHVPVRMPGDIFDNWPWPVEKDNTDTIQDASRIARYIAKQIGEPSSAGKKFRRVSMSRGLGKARLQEVLSSLPKKYLRPLCEDPDSPYKPFGSKITIPTGVVKEMARKIRFDRAWEMHPDLVRKLMARYKPRTSISWMSFQQKIEAEHAPKVAERILQDAKDKIRASKVRRQKAHRMFEDKMAKHLYMGNI